MNSQGLLYKQLGKYERALDSYKRAIEIRERLFGIDHPDTCATRHNIGEVYVMMTLPEKAQEMFNLNVELMEKKS